MVDIEPFARIVGDAAVLTGQRVRSYLRDYSWYSPLLETALADAGVDAVLRPADLGQLTAVVAEAARMRVPLTMRGAGTGNYGQSLPLERGVVVDVRRVSGILAVDVPDPAAPGRVALLPGTTFAGVDEYLAGHGHELAIMPSTYRLATVAGHVCGGSGGIGSAQYGDLWNGNVPAVELLTVEEEPRTIRLTGDEVVPVLHTYGTVGVVVRVELRSMPRREYRPLYATFDDPMSAASFAWDVMESGVGRRLVSLQPAPIPTTFTPVAHLFGPDDSAVLLLVAAEDVDEVRTLATVGGGRLADWPDAPSITRFSYSHTVLWQKKADPESSWLQGVYADDRSGFLTQFAGLHARYGADLAQHVEFRRNAGRTVPGMIAGVAGRLAATRAGTVELIEHCTSLGVTVRNPHSYVVDEGGFVGDTTAAVERKRDADPHGLLNPGKLAGSFFQNA